MALQMSTMVKRHDSNNKMNNNVSGFLNVLPYDVVTTIFSYLDQNDCIQCLNICKTWRDRVPEYTKSVWHTLKINGRFENTTRMNKAQGRFLGNHVKHVQVIHFIKKKNKNTFLDVMKQILDYGCNKIESLDFAFFETPNQNEFIKIILQPLASTLTHLTMREHYSNPALLYILSTCSHLTHFTYISSNNARIQHEVTENEPFIVEDSVSTTPTPKIKKQFDHLIYLHIDSPINKVSRLQPILQRCPNLQYFIGMSSITYEMGKKNHHMGQSTCLTLSFDELFSWCPNLICFKSNASYERQKIVKDDIVNSMINSSNNYLSHQQEKHPYKLKHLSLREKMGQDLITPFLTKNGNTLEYVSLLGCKFETPTRFFAWKSIFLSPSFPQLIHLRTLVCDSVAFDCIALVTLLNQAPMIETLELKRLQDVTFDYSIFKSLAPLHHLKYLYLEYMTFDNDYSAALFIERLCMLEKLVVHRSVMTLRRLYSFSSLERLKHLEFFIMEWSQEEEREEESQEDYQEEGQQPIPYFVPPELFTHLASSGLQHHQLEFVHLDTLKGITLEHLIAIAGISTIKHINVQLDQVLDDENEEETLIFIKKLHTTTSIETLILRDVAYLPPYPVILALSQLPFLKEIYLASPTMFLPSPSQVDEIIDVSRIMPLLCNNKLQKMTLENAIGNRTRPRMAIDNLLSEHGLSWYSTQSFTRINDDGLYLEDVRLERQ
ncbi:hypothetical protein BDC45DRAFT_525173 [Circinella umbellata]|nr:hypothetical protein BDC45DRAFT_525173 [Circinella umbellata]